MLLIILTLILNSVFATDYCTLCENRTHTMCQFKEGPAESCINYEKLLLTPAEKMYILDIHNDIRNHVASGQESRGALGNQPPAADMFLLEWDEELVEIAQRWVDQCISANASIQHDKCRRTENFEVGQNIVTAITSDVKLPELSILTLNWYKQIKYAIPSDVDEFTGTWRGKHQFGQYTQLVWAKTRFVGCAAAAFKENIKDLQYSVRFACNYGPAGNVIGEPVYQRGKPCSRCPNRVCDRGRPNLCGGADKIYVKKQKDIIFKKHKDKATTLSNLVDIENPKIDTRFINFSILNTSDNLQTDIDITNNTTTKSINFTAVELGKDFDENIYFTNVTLVNTTIKNNVHSTEMKEITDTIEENYSDSIIFTVSTEENISNNTTFTEKENYHLLNTSSTSQTLTSTERITTDYIFTTSTSFDHKTDYYINKSISPITTTAVSIYKNPYLSHILPDTTLSTNSNNDYKKNLKFKVTFDTSIKLFIESFFNQSIISKITKKPVEFNSTLDLTENKCDRVELDNGIVLVQDCEGDWRHSVHSGRKFLSQLHTRTKRIVVKGNDVILPGNRRFKRVTGIWRSGQCRCPQFLRSHTAISIVKRYLFLLISFIHFVVI